MCALQFVLRSAPFTSSAGFSTAHGMVCEPRVQEGVCVRRHSFRDDVEVLRFRVQVRLASALPLASIAIAPHHATTVVRVPSRSAPDLPLGAGGARQATHPRRLADPRRHRASARRLRPRWSSSGLLSLPSSPSSARRSGRRRAALNGTHRLNGRHTPGGGRGGLLLPPGLPLAG
jgi:hypothetical protein